MGKRTAGAAGEVQFSCEVRCSQVVEHAPTIEDAAAKIRKAEEDLKREKAAKRSFQFVGRVKPNQPTQLTGESLRRALLNAGHRFLSVCPIPAYADADNELELLSAEVMTARNVLRELCKLFAGETDGELRKLSQSLIEEIDYSSNMDVQLAWFVVEKEIECQFATQQKTTSPQGFSLLDFAKKELKDGSHQQEMLIAIANGLVNFREFVAEFWVIHTPDQVNNNWSSFLQKINPKLERHGKQMRRDTLAGNYIEIIELPVKTNKKQTKTK